ncbi:sensor histidine kinase [Galactobacter caseinivorans]|uniref:histidine kinase n=1 Tax=Galactobacter caseinivorans TaxID=2676123 RepID=A0A496PMA2_9MICC|nr:PAS domain-containing sensor histidine kinase [Galactobacter caseinivorans]RKW71653.1 ATPase [Galactobacter caseinivorans]
MGLFDAVRVSAGLSREDEEWLHLLVGDWQLVSDLAFADILLWAPAPSGGLTALAHVRPSTTHTVFHTDFVGERMRRGLRVLVDQAVDQGEPVRSSQDHVTPDHSLRVDAVPVRRDGRTVAVLTVHADVARARTSSRLEQTYRSSAHDLLVMISQGLWPDFAAPTGGRRGAPRVGDGLVRLDAAGVVEYASPNGVSAFRRLGGVDSLDGRKLTDVVDASGSHPRIADEALPLVLAGRMPWRAEVEANGVGLNLRSIPLRTPANTRYGALVLVRDVTELRRREKELVSKDATIREIHHRVKNNLQTVAALLRMQSRRMVSDEGKRGLEEAMRRVAVIAQVHDSLSQGLTQNVPFDQLVDRQVRMAAELASPGFTVLTRRTGTFGDLPTEMATPFSLVLNELVSNAVEHGLADRDGTVVVRAERIPQSRGERLQVDVDDDGVGLGGREPGGGLGTQIVRTLVTAELGGTILWKDRPEGGTRVRMDLPINED